MNKPKVFLSKNLDLEAMKELRKKCDVDVNEKDRILSKHELIDRLQDKDGALTLLTDRIDKEVIDACPKLRVVSNYAVGFNNIDIDEANERGVVVTNTPHVSNKSVADHAFALLLSASRRILEADEFMRLGKFTGWKPMFLLSTDVHSKTLGIIGLGEIGKEVAKRASGFDMEVLYNDIERQKDFEKETKVKYRKKDTLLKRADFVVLNVPLTEKTRHLIGNRELNIMKDSAFLINVARGPVVDEEALVHALKHGLIKGAGLDVYENEPEMTPGLADLKNVVLTPHLGSSTREAREAMARMAVNNLMNVLHGKDPEAQVTDIKVGPGFKHPFYVCNGNSVKTLKGLASELKSESDEVFHHHVTGDRNDFASWTREVLKEKKLANEMEKCVNKKSIISLIEESIS